MNPFPMQRVEPNEKTSLSHGQNRHELQNVLEIRSVNTCYPDIVILLTLQNLKKMIPSNTQWQALIIQITIANTSPSIGRLSSVCKQRKELEHLIFEILLASLFDLWYLYVLTISKPLYKNTLKCQALKMSLFFLLCSLYYLGLVKIYSLVRGWKYFPPGSEVLIFSTTQFCQSGGGVKGESSASIACLYLPINVMPFPHLISLCDCQPHRTVTALISLQGHI